MRTGEQSMASLKAAMDRLAKGQPTRTVDARLLDRNLQLEAGVSPATLYRFGEILEEWQTIKRRAVLSAIDLLRTKAAHDPTMVLSDRVLFDTAGVDHSAYHRMPEEVVSEWQRLKGLIGPSRKTGRRASDDQIVGSLVSKMFALVLALKRQGEVISAQNKEIARLGGNVVPLFEARREEA